MHLPAGHFNDRKRDIRARGCFSKSPRPKELCGTSGFRLKRHRPMTKQPTLTKADLIEEVLRVTELPRKESETIVETIFESIIEALQKGDKIEIRGFGSFRTRQRRGRVGRNPKTRAKVQVPPQKLPFFNPMQESHHF